MSRCARSIQLIDGYHFLITESTQFVIFLPLMQLDKVFMLDYWSKGSDTLHQCCANTDPFSNCRCQKGSWCMHNFIISVYFSRKPQKDTIWATHVVTTASRDKTEPTVLSWTSVTVAIPTPRRRMRSDSWMLLL